MVTQQSLLKTTTGNVMDLISNDVQRMETAPTGICVCFFSFSDIVVVSALVFHLIGWQGLMGILFSTMLLPCVLFISSVCARLHLEISKVSDRRISLMNELVTGIRALKTHAWEEYYEKKVMDVRRWERQFIVLHNTNLCTEAHVPTPRYGQYLTHTNNHITPAVAVIGIVYSLRVATPYPRQRKSGEREERGSTLSSFFLCRGKGAATPRLIVYI